MCWHEDNDHFMYQVTNDSLPIKLHAIEKLQQSGLSQRFSSETNARLILREAMLCRFRHLVDKDILS